MWEGVRKENLNILFSDAIYRIHIRCIWSRDCSVRPRLTYFSFIIDRHSTNGAGGRIGPQTNRDDGRNPPVRGKIIQITCGMSVAYPGRDLVGGGGGGGRPTLMFRPNWGPKGRKFYFFLSQDVDDRPLPIWRSGPATAYRGLGQKNWVDQIVLVLTTPYPPFFLFFHVTIQYIVVVPFFLT